MTGHDVLEYFPPWYQRGDPDEFGYAVLYGFVALATIWLLEHICELVLFSTAKGILLSDAAAHIALNNSNWLDVARWVLKTRRNSRLCRRAFMALMFRCLLVGIDIGILIQAIPHGIDVYENMVGGTELSFSPRAVRAHTPELRTAFLSCKPDLIRYEGFNPTTSRTICLVNVPSRPPNLDGNSTVATFYFVFSRGMLRIRSNRLYNRYLIRHSMRIVGGQTGDGTDLLISSNRDTVGLAPQAALIAAEIPLVQRWSCVPQRTGNVSAIMNCTTAPPGDLTSQIHDWMILGLFDRIGTVKVNPKGTVYSVPGRESTKDGSGVTKPAKLLDTNGLGPRLGTLTRPRLCIFPALILLLCIAAVSLVVRFFTGSQDFAWKLWRFLSLSAGMSDTNTPFSTRCTEIDVMNGVVWSGDLGRRTFDGQDLDIEERPRLHSDVPEEYDSNIPKYRRDEHMRTAT